MIDDQEDKPVGGTAVETSRRLLLALLSFVAGALFFNMSSLGASAPRSWFHTWITAAVSFSFTAVGLAVPLTPSHFDTMRCVSYIIGNTPAVLAALLLPPTEIEEQFRLVMQHPSLTSHVLVNLVIGCSLGLLLLPPRSLVLVGAMGQKPVSSSLDAGALGNANADR